MSHREALAALTWMRTQSRPLLWLLPIAIVGCGTSAVLLQSVDDGGGGRGGGGATDGAVVVDGAGLDDGGGGGDGTAGDAVAATDGDGGWLDDGGCYVGRVPGPAAWWATGEPDGGCASCAIGTTCVRGTGEHDNVYGCAPVPAGCNGHPSCACMGCICGLGCSDFSAPVTCFNGTISRRAFKDDVVYVDDAEREALARQALDIPLARYRYKTEPPDARRRLGFIIDDQPDPSPAVQADRTHVDEYGYASMLLATVQQQAKELAELRRRVETLEGRERSGEGSTSRAP